MPKTDVVSGSSCITRGEGCRLSVSDTLPLGFLVYLGHWRMLFWIEWFPGIYAWGREAERVAPNRNSCFGPINTIVRSSSKRTKEREGSGPLIREVHDDKGFYP